MRSRTVSQTWNGTKKKGSDWCWGSALSINASPGLVLRGGVVKVVPDVFCQRRVYIPHKLRVCHRNRKTQPFTLKLFGAHILEFPVVFGRWQEAGAEDFTCDLLLRPRFPGLKDQACKLCSSQKTPPSDLYNCSVNPESHYDSSPLLPRSFPIGRNPHWPGKKNSKIKKKRSLQSVNLFVSPVKAEIGH